MAAAGEHLQVAAGNQPRGLLEQLWTVGTIFAPHDDQRGRGDRTLAFREVERVLGLDRRRHVVEIAMSSDHRGAEQPCTRSGGDPDGSARNQVGREHGQRLPVSTRPDPRSDATLQYPAPLPETTGGADQDHRLNHTYQTYDFVQSKRNEFLQFSKREMPVWEAFQFLNQLVDDSDPDTDLDQFQHLLQTSEAIRADGHPDWMVAVGLMHDMGKVLCLFGEPQWAVVGDTFPVGCAHSDKIVYPEFFSYNPDTNNPELNTTLGVYKPNCGLRNVTMSWGHDEYVYQMLKIPYQSQDYICFVTIPFMHGTVKELMIIYWMIMTGKCLNG